MIGAGDYEQDKKCRMDAHVSVRQFPVLSEYIKFEMTSASAGDEKQESISDGIQSFI